MGGYVYDSLGGVMGMDWEHFSSGNPFIVFLKRCDIHLPAVPIAGDAPLIAL
jgi:hypothetical protein